MGAEIMLVKVIFLALALGRPSLGIGFFFVNVSPIGEIVVAMVGASLY